MRVQPLIVIGPLVWLVVTFWKPILVALVVLSALIYLSLPLVVRVAQDAADRYDAAVPTMYIPAVWPDALTKTALTLTVTPHDLGTTVHVDYPPVGGTVGVLLLVILILGADVASASVRAREPHRASGERPIRDLDPGRAAALTAELNDIRRALCL